LIHLSQEIIWQKSGVKQKQSALFLISAVVNLSVEPQVALVHNVEAHLHLMEVLILLLEVLLEVVELKDMEALLEHN
jgi:hypothetical protein